MKERLIITPLQSLAFTWGLAALATSLSLILLRLGFGWRVNLFVAIAVTSFIILIFVRGATVPIGHVGVPLLLGRRQRGFIFQEGHHFLIEFGFGQYQAMVLTFEPINMQTQTQSISLGEDGNLVSKNRVRMLMEVIIFYNISDCFRYLEISAGEPHKINKMIESVARSLLRKISELLSDDDIISADEVLGQGLKKEFPALVNDWGVNISNVLVTSSIQKNEKVVSAYEREIIEERERRTEKINAETVLDIIHMIAKKADVSVETAELILATQQGKVERKHITTNSGQKPIIFIDGDSK